MGGNILLLRQKLGDVGPGLVSRPLILVSYFFVIDLAGFGPGLLLKLVLHFGIAFECFS